MMKAIRIILASLIAAFGVACAPAGLAENAVVSTPDGNVKFRVETVAVGLEVPWGFAWLPNKDMLVTERRGRVRIIENGKLRAEPVFTVPDVEPTGESGLMDISLASRICQKQFCLSRLFLQQGRQTGQGRPLCLQGQKIHRRQSDRR